MDKKCRNYLSESSGGHILMLLLEFAGHGVKDVVVLAVLKPAWLTIHLDALALNISLVSTFNTKEPQSLCRSIADHSLMGHIVIYPRVLVSSVTCEGNCVKLTVNVSFVTQACCLTRFVECNAYLMASTVRL